MGLIFKDDLHNEFGTWPLAYIPYGGADFGEVAAVARAVGEGDDSAFYDAWVKAADRLAAEGQALATRGRTVSARELFLRASCFYSASYHPLYGKPVDPRLVAAFRKQIDAFNKGLALRDPPVAPLRIPFEGASLPAYFIPAVGHESAVRPLVICTNGYDASVTDMYFASVVAVTARGYHCLVFDGPGQGEMLIEHSTALRPDWEAVVRSVVDFALTMSIVDPTRIALSGWSLGGYLAPRAASGEHRLGAYSRSWPVEHGLGPSSLLHKAGSARRGRSKSRRDRSTAPRADVAGHHPQPQTAVDHCPARILGERRRKPSRLSTLHRNVHNGPPGCTHSLPDADHARRRRSAGGQRADLLRCAALPQRTHSIQFG